MATIIKASEVGPQVYALLVESVESTMASESTESKQVAISAILGALSVEFFH